MQIQANPWNFGPGDQAIATPIASIANQNRSALVTTSAAHNLQVNSIISLQGLVTVPQYKGGYTVLSVPSPTTFLIEKDYELIGLPNSGAEGTVFTAVYLAMIRAEQILWYCTSLNASLLLTDVAGHQVYSAAIGNIAPTGPFTYGKLFWISGLVINTFAGTALTPIDPASLLQITIN